MNLPEHERVSSSRQEVGPASLIVTFLVLKTVLGTRSVLCTQEGTSGLISQ